MNIGDREGDKDKDEEDDGKKKEDEKEKEEHKDKYKEDENKKKNENNNNKLWKELVTHLSSPLDQKKQTDIMSPIFPTSSLTRRVMCLGRYAAFNNLYPPLLLFSSDALFPRSSSPPPPHQTQAGRQSHAVSLSPSPLVFPPPCWSREEAVSSFSAAVWWQHFKWHFDLRSALFVFFCRDEIRLETPATALIIKGKKKRLRLPTLFLEPHSSLETTCDCVFSRVFFFFRH